MKETKHSLAPRKHQRRKHLATKEASDVETNVLNPRCIDPMMPVLFIQKRVLKCVHYRKSNRLHAGAFGLLYGVQVSGKTENKAAPNVSFSIFLYIFAPVFALHRLSLHIIPRATPLVLVEGIFCVLNTRARQPIALNPISFSTLTLVH